MARYIDTTKLMNNMVTFVSSKLAQSIIKAVDETPTEDVAPIVRGVWRDLGSAIQCSNCETLYPKIRVDLKHYCERCGSKNE